MIAVGDKITYHGVRTGRVSGVVIWHTPGAEYGKYRAGDTVMIEITSPRNTYYRRGELVSFGPLHITKRQ